MREELFAGAGPADEVLDIAALDAGTTWAFRRTGEQPVTFIDEGLFDARGDLDVTQTRPRDIRIREVIRGSDPWAEDSRSHERRHCPLQADRVPTIPLAVGGWSSPPVPGLGHLATPEGVFIVVGPGSRLSVERGTSTTLDGEPATSYVWVAASAPSLWLVLVLDKRNRLRRVTITYIPTDQPVASMSADPTDARIVDPSNQPIVTLP